MKRKPKPQPGASMYVTFATRLNMQTTDAALRYTVASGTDANGNPAFSSLYEPRNCSGLLAGNRLGTGASIAFHNGTLIFAYPSTSGDLEVLHLGTCGGLNSAMYSVNARTSQRPGIISRDGRLTLVFKSWSNGLIRYSHSDDGGITWYGNTAAAGDTGGSISLISG